MPCPKAMGTGAGKEPSVPEGEIVVNKYGVWMDIHLAT